MLSEYFLAVKVFFIKSMSINNFMKIRLLFGYYHMFTSSKAIIALYTLACLSSYVFIIILGLTQTQWMNMSGFLILHITSIMVKNTLNMSICGYHKDVYFYEFLASIDSIDRKLRSSPGPFCFVTGAVFYFLVVLKLLHMMYIIVFIKTLNSIQHVCMTVLIISNSVSNLTNIIIYELLWSRMKILRLCIASDIKDESKLQYDVIKKVISLYDMLMNSIDRVKPFTHTSMFLNIIYEIFKLTIYIYYFLFIFIQIGSKPIIWVVLNEVIYGFLFLIVCPILAELTSYEYEKFYDVVVDQILDCKDDNLQILLYSTLKYLKARPPSYVIFRLFPFNVKFIFGIFNICTTYIIILLQFSLHC